MWKPKDIKPSKEAVFPWPQPSPLLCFTGSTEGPPGVWGAGAAPAPQGSALGSSIGSLGVLLFLLEAEFTSATQ